MERVAAKIAAEFFIDAAFNKFPAFFTFFWLHSPLIVGIRRI
jgi:hypothetical protein